MPDWIPLAAVFLLLPAYIIAYRRALTAPMAQLFGRAAMGGERSRTELKQVHLRQLTWYSVALPTAMGAGIGLLAALAKPEFRASHPYIFGGIVLLGAYLIIAGGIAIHQKWKAEKGQPNAQPPQ
jgi:hypothetical protein